MFVEIKVLSCVSESLRLQGGALASDAMLESVMIIRLATGAMVEVVVPFGFSKAGFISGCPVELGVVAASKEGTRVPRTLKC